VHTVAVAAAEDLLSELRRWFESSPVYTLVWSGGDLRAAVSRAAEGVDVLVVDEAVLRDHLGWLEHVRALTCPVLVVGPSDPAAFRHALTAGAKDFLARTEWPDLLAGALERLVRKPDSQSHPLVAVFSPKGGVGKTTLAANLACAVAERAHGPVALVDCDLQFGDLATLLGLDPPATVYDAVRLTRLSEEALERLLAPVPGTGVRLLAAPAQPLQAEEIRAEAMLAVLEALRASHAAVVVDTALGYTDVNVAVLDFADQLLLVATPDVVTIRATARALELFREGFGYPDDKIRLVLNREGSGIGRDEVEAALDRPVAFGLPSDGAWPVRAANEGRPLWVYRASSAFVRGLDPIAATIVPDRTPPRRAWFRRRHAVRPPGPAATFRG
jgi:pilus assembly protein CpaE